MVSVRYRTHDLITTQSVQYGMVDTETNLGRPRVMCDVRVDPSVGEGWQHRRGKYGHHFNPMPSDRD